MGCHVGCSVPVPKCIVFAHLVREGWGVLCNPTRFVHHVLSWLQSYPQSSAPARARTWNLRIRSPLLYPIGLRGPGPTLLNWTGPSCAIIHC